MAWPNPRANSGIFFGPKSRRKTTESRIISGVPKFRSIYITTFKELSTLNASVAIFATNDAAPASNLCNLSVSEGQHNSPFWISYNASEMPKEYWGIIAIALFILASVLDSLAGTVSLTVGTNPFSFLSGGSLATYPFTAVAIGVRALGFVITVLLVLAVLIEKNNFIKATILFGLGALAELYAIQQLATGLRTTPINYTLSIAYAGAALILPVAIYLLKGAFGGVGAKVSGEPEEKSEDSQKRIEKIKTLEKDHPAGKED